MTLDMSMLLTTLLGLSFLTYKTEKTAHLEQGHCVWIKSGVGIFCFTIN